MVSVTITSELPLFWLPVSMQAQSPFRVASKASHLVAHRLLFWGQQCATCTSPIMHRPPKFCITFVFHFSWVLQLSQEKLKTMLMQIFGGANKVHYGRCASGVGTFSTHKLTRQSNRTPIVLFCFCSDHFVCICCGLILSLV